MVDQSRNLKNKMEEMIQTAVAAQELYAKAALVDHEKLLRHQAKSELVDAEECLKDAPESSALDNCGLELSGTQMALRRKPFQKEPACLAMSKFVAEFHFSV
jgi:hypothetical protein